MSFIKWIGGLVAALALAACAPEFDAAEDVDAVEQAVGVGPGCLVCHGNFDPTGLELRALPEDHQPAWHQANGVKASPLSDGRKACAVGCHFQE